MKLKTVFQLLILTIIIVPFNSQGEDGHPYYGKPPGNPARGATEWANNCARCHNMRSPSEQTDDIWHVIVSHMRVRAGLTGQQTRDILAYLMSVNYTPVAASAGQTRKAASGLSGQQIFSNTCVACHGADGKGALPNVPDLAERLTKTDATLITNVTKGFQSPGSPMMMPARGGNPDLSDEDIKAVVKYIRDKFGTK